MNRIAVFFIVLSALVFVLPVSAQEELPTELPCQKGDFPIVLEGYSNPVVLCVVDGGVETWEHFGGGWQNWSTTPGDEFGILISADNTPFLIKKWDALTLNRESKFYLYEIPEDHSTLPGGVECYGDSWFGYSQGEGWEGPECPVK